MKIGIYGGSFNPIHKGHLHIINSSIKEYAFDRIYLMPSFVSPNKIGIDMAAPEDRIQMCRLAVKGIPRVIVSDYEAMRQEISYTYKTMTHFHESFPQDQLYFLLGADSLDYFSEWVHPEIICRYASLLVLSREGFSKSEQRAKSARISDLFHTRVYFLESGEFNASSSQIREELLRNDVCPAQLGEEVYQYILDHHIYGK